MIGVMVSDAAVEEVAKLFIHCCHSTCFDRVGSYLFKFGCCYTNNQGAHPLIPYQYVVCKSDVIVSTLLSQVDPDQVNNIENMKSPAQMHIQRDGWECVTKTTACHNDSPFTQVWQVGPINNAD
eukprot:3054307-Amphidinium_carterae.1